MTSFERSIGDDLRQALEQEASTVYALDATLKIDYVNPAWFEFARNNDGQKLLASFSLGSRLDRCLPAVLRPFYVGRLWTTLQTGAPWTHRYECSTAEKHRTYLMRVSRIEKGPFLIVANDFVSETTATDAMTIAELGILAGVVTQCSHCRRIRRSDGTWGWVPAYVKDPPTLVSHGLCKPCAAYHYPDA